MRGRVMALWAMLFLGSTPIGGPTVGWIAERFGPRVSMSVGGAATLVAGLAAVWALRRRRTILDREPARVAGALPRKAALAPSEA